MLIIPQVFENGYDLMHSPVLGDKLINVFSKPSLNHKNA